MKRFSTLLFACLVVLGVNTTVRAAEKSAPLEISAKPDHADYLYNLGDSAVFTIEVKRLSGKKAPLAIAYRLSEDGERTLSEL